MNILNLLKAPKTYVVYAAVVFYAITFSFSAIIAPSPTHAVGSQQGINQLVKTEANGRTFTNNDNKAHSGVIRTISKNGLNISHLVGNNDPS